MKYEFALARIRKIVEEYIKDKTTGSITIHFSQGGFAKIEKKQTEK